MSATASPPAPASTSPSTSSDLAARRASQPLHQQPGPKLFFAGLLFASFSALSTRRALVRRRAQNALHAQQQPPLQTTPFQARHPAQDTILTKGQVTPNAPASTIVEASSHSASGSATAAVEAGVTEGVTPDIRNNNMLVALEALSLATINVLSWGMVGAGGVLWGWDIRNLEEGQRKVRGGLGIDGTGRSEKEVEEEMEEWIVDVIARKETKESLKDKVERRKDERGRVREV